MLILGKLKKKTKTFLLMPAAKQKKIALALKPSFYESIFNNMPSLRSITEDLF